MRPFRATLKMIKTKHEKHPHRTPEVDGSVMSPIAVGFSVVMYATPLENTNAACREVTTSPIVALHWDSDGCHFETANSIYDLRIKVSASELAELKTQAATLAEEMLQQDLRRPAATFLDS